MGKHLLPTLGEENTKFFPKRLFTRLEGTIASNEVTLSMKAVAKLKVISNI